MSHSRDNNFVRRHCANAHSRRKGRDRWACRAEINGAGTKGVYMNHKMSVRIVLTLVVVLFASAAAFAGGDDDKEVKGMIISRAGDTMVVRQSDGNKVTVVLTDD